MKRSGILFSGVVMAAMVVGCSNDKKKDEQAMTASKYKLLQGNTSDAKDPWNQPEPALNANTRFAAGQLAESQGKLDCAIVQYDQAIRLNPKHVPSLYRQGVALTKMKQYDQAVEIWHRYIKATGNDASGYSNLGFTFEMAADVENAEKSYKKGLDIDPKNVPCRVNYGMMLARNNRNDEAEAQLIQVLPPDEVAFNLASIYEQQGAIEQARAELNRALKANPRNLAAQQKLASLPPETVEEAAAPTEPIDQEMQSPPAESIEKAVAPTDETMESQDSPEEVKAPVEPIEQ